MDGTFRRLIHSAFLLLAVALVIHTTGCSDQPKDSSATDGSSASTKAETNGKTASAQPVAPPNEVVTAFLDALRKGDQETVESLISPVAREEMPKYGLKVEPLGTPDAQFEIAQVEYPKEMPGTAYVACVWKEPMPDGSLEAFEVVWVAKQQSDGQWRVAGMAMEGPKHELVFFNFEKPAEMMQQRDALAAAYEAEAQAQAAQNTTPPPAASTAQQPQDSGSVRR